MNNSPIGENANYRIEGAQLLALKEEIEKLEKFCSMMGWFVSIAEPEDDGDVEAINEIKEIMKATLELKCLVKDISSQEIGVC